ncbi:hypothetical protein SEA_DELRIO_68 [Gordonia phage DelRio]|nr:hypothetical protein SEA_DELRIO_68 [Gordonia phage DelRio]
MARNMIRVMPNRSASERVQSWSVLEAQAMSLNGVTVRHRWIEIGCYRGNARGRRLALDHGNWRARKLRETTRDPQGPE